VHVRLYVSCPRVCVPLGANVSVRLYRFERMRREKLRARVKIEIATTIHTCIYDNYRSLSINIYTPQRNQKINCVDIKKKKKKKKKEKTETADGDFCRSLGYLEGHPGEKPAVRSFSRISREDYRETKYLHFPLPTARFNSGATLEL